VVLGDDPAVALAVGDLRDLLLAIEGPAADEHPYEACNAEVPGTP
jgi:hypothetical protein